MIVMNQSKSRKRWVIHLSFYNKKRGIYNKKRYFPESMCLRNLAVQYLYKNVETNYDYCFEQSFDVAKALCASQL